MICFTCYELHIAILFVFLVTITDYGSALTAIEIEQAKKQEWIKFCDEKTTKCPFLNSPTAIPLATTLKKKANGTMNAITTKFLLQSFQGISELEQQFSLQGTFTFQWELPDCAKWQEAKGGETPNYCAIPRDNMWHPVFYHANALGQGSPFDTGVDQVTVKYTGEAVWYARGRFDGQCSLSFKNFPFDEQACSLIMRWQRVGDSQNVQVWPSMVIEPGAFADTNVWELADSTTKVYHYDDARQVEFVFKLRRRPQTFAGSIFLPMVLLMVTQTTVYCIPAEIGDRIGMSITVFLSSAVLLTFISTSIPATAETLGIIVLFGAQTTLGVAVTVYTTITIRLADNYAEKYKDETIKPIRWLGFRCTRINFIDSIAAAITIFAYLVLCVVILGLMVTGSSYSPFYTEPPIGHIVQNESVHLALGQAARDGNVQEVKRLLQLPGIDVNWVDDRNFRDCGRPAAFFPTAIRRAVSCNHTDVVRLLVKKGARVNETDADRQSDTFLIMAILHNNTEMVRLLLDYDVSVVQIKTESEIFNALAAAAYTGSTKMAQILLDRGAVNNDTNSTNSTVAMIAASRGHYHLLHDMSDILNGTVTCKDRDNKTAVYYAARSGDNSTFRHVADAFEKNLEKEKDHLPVADLSLENLKQTVHVAAKYGFADIVNYYTFGNFTAYTCLNEKKEQALMTALRAAFERGDPDGNYTATVSIIVRQPSDARPVDVNFVGQDQQTPLMLAASLKRLDIARILLEYHANISQKDNMSRTPFFYAARYSTYEMVQLFVEHGDNVSAVKVIRQYYKDNEGKLQETLNGNISAIHHAAGNNDTRILKYLYNLATSLEAYDMSEILNTEDEDGNTPMMEAIGNGCLENVRFLLGVSTSWLGTMMAHRGTSNALQRGLAYLPIFGLLVERYPGFVNQSISRAFMTPLHIAAYFGSDSELFQFLLHHQAGVNVLSRADDWLYSTEGTEKERESHGLQILKGDDVKVDLTRDPNKYFTPLMCAILGKQPVETVDALVNYKANVSIATNRGWTPLMFAAIRGNMSVVNTLIEHGADVNAVEMDDHVTPLLIAASYGNVEVVNVLLQHGARVSGRSVVTPTTYKYAIRLCIKQIKTLNEFLGLTDADPADQIAQQNVDEDGATKAQALVEEPI